MQRKKKKGLLSWLLVFVLSVNMLAPLLPVYAQTNDANTVENQLQEAEDETTPGKSDGDTKAPEEEATPEASPEATPEGKDGSTAPGITEGDKAAANQEQKPDAAPNADEGDGTPQGVIMQPLAARPAADVSDLLEREGDLEISLRTADGATEINEITVGVPFMVRGSFKVPVVGDGVTEYVIDGDTADLIDIPAHLVLQGSGKDRLPLIFGGEQVGVLNFDDVRKVVRVEFDSEGVLDGVMNVVCEFEAIYTHNGEGIPDGGSSEDQEIFGKKVTITKPEVVVTRSIEKAGKVSATHPGEIEWTVTVNATQNNANISLEGLIFEDDLTSVGEYVENSFKVGNSQKEDSEVYNAAGNKLSYTFGKVTGAQTITFRTKISENIQNFGGKVTNTAKFGKENDWIEKPADVSVEGKTFIKKSGTSTGSVEGVYDPKSQHITWTITVDPQGAGLTNVSVTDPGASADPLTWVSAKWEWPQDGAQSDITLPPAYTAEPTGGIYALGNGSTPLTKPVKLVVVSKVPDKDYVGSSTTIYNRATLNADQLTDGQQSNNAGVGVGIAGITKTASALDRVKRQVTWKVTVDLKQQSGFGTDAAFTAYDLLIYGKSGSFTASQSNLSTLLGDKEVSRLTARYGLKYVDGTFTGSGLSVTAHPVIVGGTRVGDLLEVTGFDVSKEYPFEFKTDVLDPALFASNKTATSGDNQAPNVINNASLFFGDEYLNQAQASVRYTSSILSKGILRAGETENGTAANGFNYQDRTAVFKLNINADGSDLTGALGKITVVDTLPEGWSFADFGTAGKYELYTSDGTLVTDVSEIFDAAPAFDNTAGTATFVFKKLDASYYILVKAQLSEEKYLEYLKETDGSGNLILSKTVSNTVKMTAEKDTDWSAEGKQDVTVKTEALDKRLTPPGDGESLPKWTIYFNPYGLKKLENVTITDTLPEGLSLKTDRDGKLADGAVVVTEYTDPGNGTFPTAGGTVLSLADLVADGKLTYDTNTRQLVFKPADGKLYKIEYETLVSGDVRGNTTLTNNVVVSGSDGFETGTGDSWSVSENWASARFERIGMLEITKVDGSGEVLPGAEFGLFTDAACTNRILTGISGANGIAAIRGIPSPQGVGEEAYVYYLKETQAPDGYLADGKVYTVKVEMRENAEGKQRTFVWIGDNEGAGNKLTVTNFTESELGSLTVRKQVVKGEEGKEFTFTITVDSDAVKGNTYPAAGAAESVTFGADGKATITLKDGEFITINNLPDGTEFTVEETDYGQEYKTKVSVNPVDGEDNAEDGRLATGSILAEENQVVEFTNTRKLGDLTISKTVENSEETDKLFEFTITLDDEALFGKTFAATGKYETVTFNDEGKAVIMLKSGETVTIKELPDGTGYEVTEADYSDGYTTKVLVNGESPEGTASGAIVDEQEQTVAFTNSRRLGALTISKTVVNSEETDKEFEFTITLDNEALKGKTFEATGTYDSVTFDDELKAVIKLKAGESVTINGLPDGTGYTVTEADYSDGYYTEALVNGDSAEVIGGTISDEQAQTVEFTNIRRLGDLTISKTVVNSEEEGKEFEFTVTLDNEALKGKTFEATGAHDAVTFDEELKAVIKLKAGENVTIHGLPQGTGYTVTEADYSAGYITGVVLNGEAVESGNAAAGNINDEQPQLVEFTNSRRLGDLTISKKVVKGDENKEFEFTVTLDNEALKGQEFEATGAYDSVTFDDEAKAVIKLKAGESVTIKDLPQGTEYTVTEADYSKEYVAEVSVNGEKAEFNNAATGNINDEEAQTVEFTNTRIVGGLTIGKVLKNGDKTKEFEFTVVIEDDTVKGKTFEATGKQESVTFDNDGKAAIKLKGGERVTIYDLPDGAKYTVTEADYSKEYTAEVAKNGEKAVKGRTVSGTISADSAQTVIFTNTLIEKPGPKGPGTQKPKGTQRPGGGSGKARTVRTGDNTSAGIFLGFLGSAFAVAALIVLGSIVRKKRR